MAAMRSTLLVDDELIRLRMGRYSGEEAEERRMWSSDSMRLALPGPSALLGPSLGSALGLPALRSTRAQAMGQTPFALIHRTVSKRQAGGSVARKDRVYFSLSPGQARDARLLAGAVERPSGRLVGGALRWQKSAKAWYAPRGSEAAARLGARYAIAPPPLHAPPPTARPAGTASAHQRYIEREGAAELVAGVAYSRGSIGDDLHERAAFWRAVEKRERADGLVQCRIIAELPHEISPEGRRDVADAFLTCFVERGLPAHAVIHRPDVERNPRSGGDPRNVHLHLVYHDRPARREGSGRWSFAAKKDREARGRAWLKTLRERYAACCNAVLEREGSPRRYFPGRYEELGIEKIPQAHLGPVLAAFERQGRPTRLGALNLICERDWERRALLDAAAQTARAVSESFGRLAGPRPEGPLAAASAARLEARAGTLASEAAPLDAALVDAAIEARDRDGRRDRAARLARHAARAKRGRRGDARTRAAWEEAERVAGEFLDTYRPAAPVVDERRVRRRVAEALAAGRQFDAASLLDRRAALVERIEGEAGPRMTPGEVEAARAAAEAATRRARLRARAAREDLEAALTADYSDPGQAARLLIAACEAGGDGAELLRDRPLSFGALRPGRAPPAAAAAALERCLRAESRAREATATARTLARRERRGGIPPPSVEPPALRRARRRRRRGLLRDLDTLDLEIAARPSALRLARRLGLREEIERRAARARRRGDRGARER